MNTAMLKNPITQENIARCRSYGMKIIDSADGFLACGDSGTGALAPIEHIYEHIAHEIAYTHDFAGKKVLVTAGPTQEAIDPVRFISNHSTGKMGYAIAAGAALRGAEVTLISGPTEIAPPLFVTHIPVVSAKDMYTAVKEAYCDKDIIIKAAAVADYTPRSYSNQKIKKSDGELNLPLNRTDDILAYVGAHKQPQQFLCGFAMETEQMRERARAKLKDKNLDMIVANNLATAGAIFGTDTNVVTIITAQKEIELPLLSKMAVAQKILDEIAHALI